MKWALCLAGLATIFLSGCSKFLDKFSRLESTTVRISSKRTNYVTAADLQGGIMVYATNTASGATQALTLNDEDHDRVITLPNGNYRFTAVGWPTDEMQGDPKCGFGNNEAPINLSGIATTVSITLSNSNCARDEFSEASLRDPGLIEPAIVFCDPNADFAAFDYNSICTVGLESSRFFQGSFSGTGIEESRFDFTTKRIVYYARQHDRALKELYSAPLSGIGTVRQSGIFPTGTEDILDFDVVPGSGKVVYLSDFNVSGTFELFISTLGSTAPPVKISGAIAGGLSSPGVKGYKVSEDGNYVVFVGQMDLDAFNEIYSISLTPPYNRIRLSSNLTPVGGEVGVQDWGGGYAFQISPNSTDVIFAGTFEDPIANQVYSSAINAASSVKIGQPSGINASTIVTFLD